MNYGKTTCQCALVTISGLSQIPVLGPFPRLPTTDADATLIFTFHKIGKGSTLTLRLAEKHHKPCLHIDVEKKTDAEAFEDILEWIDEVQPDVLNVAGSRESSAVGIYNRTYAIMKNVLSQSIEQHE